MYSKIPLIALTLSLMSVITKGQMKPQVSKKIQQGQTKYGKSLGVLLNSLDFSINRGTVPYMDTAKNYLLSLPDVKDAKIKKYDKLVSDYAFRKLIKKNFHNLVLGSDDVSKIGRYASLDISDKPAFSFSPFIFESNTYNRRFQHIFSLNFSGKTDAKGVFKLKDFRELKAGISWKFILPKTNYKPIDRPESLGKYKHLLSEAIIDLTEGYEDKFKKIDNSAHLNKVEKDEEKIKLKNLFIEEYTDVEVATAEPFWERKKFLWVSVDIDFWGRDKFDYISKSSLSTGNYQIINKDVYTPGAKLGFNYYTINKGGHSLLVTAFAGLQIKHSLSEVYEPSDFQSYSTVNDSISLIKGTESVFVTDFSEIDTKSVFDLGIRTVGIIKIAESSVVNKAGLSLSFSKNGLVGTESSATLFRTEIGLVLPFLDSKGESNFNLEIFKRWDTYSNFPNTNSNFWGVRFNVPISN